MNTYLLTHSPSRQPFSVKYRDPIILLSVSASLVIVGIALAIIAGIGSKYWATPLIRGLGGAAGGTFLAGLLTLIIPLAIAQAKTKHQEKRFIETVSLHCPQPQNNSNLEKYPPFSKEKRILVNHLYELINENPFDPFTNLLDRFKDDSSIFKEIFFKELLFLKFHTKPNPTDWNGTVFEYIFLKNNLIFFKALFTVSKNHSVPELVNRYNFDKKFFSKGLFSIQDANLISLILSKMGRKGFISLVEIAFEKGYVAWLQPILKEWLEHDYRQKELKEISNFLIHSSFPVSDIAQAFETLKPFYLEHPIKESIEHNNGSLKNPTLLIASTPLHIALKEHKTLLAIELIKNADVLEELKLRSGDRPFGLLPFVSMNSLGRTQEAARVTEALLKKGLDPNAMILIDDKIDKSILWCLQCGKHSPYVSPLFYAAVYGYEEIVGVLLQYGTEGKSAYESAAKAGFTRAAELIKNKAKI